MIAKLRLIALVLAALLAIAAPAGAAQLHSEAKETTWSGSQSGTNLLTTDSGTIHCSTATFTGATTASTTSELTISPTYTGCQSTGHIKTNGTVDANGCKWKLSLSGTASLTGCNEAKGIVVTLPFCNIQLTEQEVEGVDFASAPGSGRTRTIETTFTIGNLKYHESGFACKNPGAINTTGGSYTGSISLTGETEEEIDHVGVWVE